jgi:hypothetical protein
MAFRVRKTEHSGAKHGRGALWGTKYEAKSQSSKVRRRNSKAEILEQADQDRVVADSLNEQSVSLLKRDGPYDRR